MPLIGLMVKGNAMVKVNSKGIHIMEVMSSNESD